MKTVICSHGFGVRADSRGMFPEVAAAFPEYIFRMFDYNEVKPNGDTIVAPLDKQAETLQKEIDAADGEIILLCHSQGSVIAGLVDLTKVSKVILLAPPVLMSMQHLINRMRGRPGARMNPNGMSILPRSDGSKSYLPKEYLESLEGKNLMDIYQKVADTKLTVIIRATNDEIIGLTNVNEIRNAQHIDIAAGHNFKDAGRQKLIATLDTVL